MKIYICGPITGHTDLNRPAFESAEKLLRDLGHDPVNPHKLCFEIVDTFTGSEEELWRECMKADVRELVTCDGLVTLPGWLESRGAKVEVWLAKSLGIPVSSLADFHYSSGI